MAIERATSPQRQSYMTSAQLSQHEERSGDSSGESSDDRPDSRRETTHLRRESSTLDPASYGVSPVHSTCFARSSGRHNANNPLTLSLPLDRNPYWSCRRLVYYSLRPTKRPSLIFALTGSFGPFPRSSTYSSHGPAPFAHRDSMAFSDTAVELTTPELSPGLSQDEFSGMSESHSRMSFAPGAPLDRALLWDKTNAEA